MTALVAVSMLFCPWQSVAGEFEQNFSSASSVKELVGAGAGQFDFIDRAGDAAKLSVADGAFQVDVVYDPSNPEKQNSGVRLTRLTPVVDGATFLVIRCKLSMRPRFWPERGNSVFNVVVGDNFRATPFFPARDNRSDEGPAFASVSLIGTRADGELAFSTGPRQSSSSFSPKTDSDGDSTLDLVFVFNAGSGSMDFSSPSGPREIPPGTFSIWVDEALVWQDVPAAHPNAKLNHFSFGLGRGTDSTAEEGATAEGNFRLADITVTAAAN